MHRWRMLRGGDDVVDKVLQELPSGAAQLGSAPDRPCLCLSTMCDRWTLADPPNNPCKGRKSV